MQYWLQMKVTRPYHNYPSQILLNIMNLALSLSLSRQLGFIDGLRMDLLLSLKVDSFAPIQLLSSHLVPRKIKQHFDLKNIHTIHKFISLEIFDVIFLKSITGPWIRFMRTPFKWSLGNLQTSISHWTSVLLFLVLLWPQYKRYLSLHS